MEVLRYTAFSSDPAGGNRAGVVLDATGAADAEMQAVAADVGYSETAFLVPDGDRTFDVRYFSPLAEVAFCGHATIASAVAVAERSGPGPLVFRTPVGEIPLETTVRDGRVTASLTSVEPSTTPLPDADLDELLAALRWDRADLDPALPPRVGFAGNLHPILAAATRERLADLDYDFDRLAALMAARDWTTVDLVHRAAPDLFWPATRSRPAASSRTRPPAPRPPRSAATCASSVWCARRRRSRSGRATTSGVPAC